MRFELRSVQVANTESNCAYSIREGSHTIGFYEEGVAAMIGRFRLLTATGMSLLPPARGSSGRWRDVLVIAGGNNEWT